MYTIESVKQDLPAVKIRINGKIVEGSVKGRKNRFATVRYENYQWDFAWETIVRALNNDTPLRVD